MFKPTKRYKRISFLLNRNLFDSLTNYSLSQGIPKSKLIRKFLSKFDGSIVTTQANPTDDSACVTLSLTESEYSSIKSKSKTLGFNISTFIRLSISNSLLTINHREDDVADLRIFQNLDNQGLYSELAQRVGNDIENANIDLLYLYTKAFLEMGMLTRTLECIELLREKSSEERNAEMLLNCDSLLIDLHMYNRNNHLAQTIAENLIINPETYSYRRIMGFTYCQLGEIESYKDNFETSLSYYYSALDYLDIQTHPMELARVYIRMGRLWEYKFNLDLALQCFSKAAEIARKKKNVYYYGWYLKDIGVYNHIVNRIDDSLDCTIKSMDMYNKSGGVRGLYYGTDYIGRLHIFQHNYSSSYALLKKAEGIENQFRPAAVSTTFWFKKFIESRDNYKDSIKILEKNAIEHSEYFCPTMASYIINSAKYIHGTIDSEIEEGKLNLKQLAHEGNYELLKMAAKKTIETKILYPVR